MLEEMKKKLLSAFQSATSGKKPRAPENVHYRQLMHDMQAAMSLFGRRRPGKLPRESGPYTNHIPKGWMSKPTKKQMSLWKDRS